jgi:hypothetical protein
MAKRQYEGPDSHVSPDQTTGDVPRVKSGSGPFPKYVFVKDGEGFKSILVQSQEQLDSLPEGWAESPADHGVITHPDEAQAAEIEARKATDSEEKAE